MKRKKPMKKTFHQKGKGKSSSPEDSSPGYDPSEALFKAVIHNNKGEVAMLLNEGANPNAKEPQLKSTPLHAAAFIGLTDIIELLLDYNADPSIQNVDGLFPVDLAVEEQKTAAATLLLLRGPSPSGDPSIVWAAEIGATDIVYRLLEEGVDIELTNKKGQTALFVASMRNRIHIVKGLISRGADLDTTDNNNKSPLWIASRRGYTNIVNVLLNKGADPNIVDNKNESALHQAAQHGFTNIVKLLLDKKANINLKDNNGKTALDWAKRGKHKDTISLLETSIKTKKSKIGSVKKTIKYVSKKLKGK